jgi:streptogramin lyase
MRICQALLLLALANTFAPVVCAQQTTVNFDIDPSGAAVASGTDVSSLYSSVGVSFSVLPCPWTTYCFVGVGGTPEALAAPCAKCPSGSFAASPPNVIGIGGGSPIYAVSEQSGILKATFSTPQTSVSIQVYSVCIGNACLDNTQAPYLKAFGPTGTLLATNTTSSETSALYTLTVTGIGIAYVEFSAAFNVGNQTQQAGYFDNLTFSGGSTEPSVTSFSAGITGAPLETTLGPDGAVWFAEWTNAKIGRIAMDGTVTEYAVSAHPFGITTGPDGAIWFTDYAGSKVDRLDPATGIVTNQYNVGADPYGITTGPDGALWFAELGAAKIGRLDLQGNFRESAVLVTEEPAGAQPFNITVGPDGNLWFTEQGGIGSITPAMVVTQYGQAVVPYDSGRAPGPIGIVSGPDGNIWFTEFNNNFIGNINPTTGKVTQYPIPAGQLAQGITTGPDGNLWFCGSSSGQIGSISPSGTVNLYSAKGASPQYITIGADGALWFTDSNRAMGRVVLPGTTPVVELYPLSPHPSFPLFDDLVLGVDNAMWFASTNGVARATITGGLSSFSTALTAGSITLGVDGALWYTYQNNCEPTECIGDIVRLAPNGVTTTYPLPATSNNTPLTIVSGPDGALWFTDWAPAYPVAKIGRIDLSGRIVEYSLPEPYTFLFYLAVGPDGNLWFSASTNPDTFLIGKITTTGSIQEYVIPMINGLQGAAELLVAGPDGNMWFVETGIFGVPSLPTQVASISTAGVFGPSYLMPTNTHTVGPLSVGSDGAIWFFGNGSGEKVSRLDLGTKAISQYPVDSNPGFVSNLTPGPDGAMWFLDTNNRIGRISTPTATNSQVTKILTSNINVTLTVDGSTCSTPCTFSWAVGSRHAVTAPSFLLPKVGFTGWSDGGAASHTITANWGPLIYVANYSDLTPCEPLHTATTVTIADVQEVINEILGLVRAVADLNGDGAVNVVDTQIVTNAVLGLGCVL